MWLRSSRFLFAIATAALLVSGSAKANTIYSYTGNAYTYIEDSPNVPGTYTTSMNVTGWFEMTSPLGASFNNLGADTVPTFIIDFSFNDGLQTFDPSNINTAVGYSAIAVKTDSSGDIIDWDIYFSDITNPNRYASTQGSVTPQDNGFNQILDVGVDQAFTNLTPGGAYVSDPTRGTWAVIPEPTTSALLSLGLAGLAMFSRHRR